MATLKEIAKEAGVSVQTVSNVLSGKNKEHWPGIRKRAENIRRIASEMGYRPSAVARAMRGKSTQIIGVLLRNEPGCRFYYIAAHEFILGINEYLETQGYIVSIVRNSDVRGHNASRVFQEQIIDGMIVVENSLDDVRDMVTQLVPKCLWLDCSRFSKYNCVRRDEKHTGKLLAKSLLELGYKQFIWLGEALYRKPNQHYSLIERFNGFNAILKKNSIEIDVFEPWYADKNIPHIDFDELKGKLKPDVVLVAYDSVIARRLSHQAGMMGLKVGKDFGLACFDETHEVAGTWPELTRISNDRFDMGQLAAKMFLELLKSSNDIGVGSKKIKGHFIAGKTAPGLVK